VFVGVYAVMAVLVVGITMSVVKAAPRTAGRLAATSPTLQAGRGSAGRMAIGPGGDLYAPAGHGNQGYGGSRAGVSALPQAGLNMRLTAALRPAAAICPGRLSVAIRDRTTGAEALSLAGQSYPAVTTAAADILAVLLYQHQESSARLGNALEPTTTLTIGQYRVSLSGSQSRLAARMFGHGSRAAAAAVWRLIGGASGFDAGAVALRLTHTVAPPGAGWRRMTTTAADQLQLLADLTSAASPLAPVARAAEVALLARGETAGRPGAAAAASPGSSYAGSNAWHAGLTGSVAIVRHGSQKLAVVVLSQGCASLPDGMAVAAAAARAAAAMITAVAPAHASRGRPS